MALLQEKTMVALVGAVPIPDDTVWTDRFNFNRFDASNRYTLGGRLVICQAPKQKGLPVTLQAEWVSLDVVNQIVALNESGNPLNITTACGVTMSVCWDYASPPSLLVVPVKQVSCYEDCDYYDCEDTPEANNAFNLTLKFLTT
jgi:hypothetical protein